MPFREETTRVISKSLAWQAGQSQGFGRGCFAVVVCVEQWFYFKAFWVLGIHGRHLEAVDMLAVEK
jgi:hypothetical protein